MGTTLTGTTPQDTYDSLIKVTDNGPLSGTLKALSDGLGNDSTLSLSTTAASIAGTLSVTGNATFDTTTLFVDAANDRVGVGTITPSEKLQIQGNVVVNKDSTSANFVSKTFTTGHAVANRGGSVLFGMDDSTATGMKITTSAATNPSFNKQEIEFITHEGGGSVGTRLFINSTGNVGIGTSAPLERLVVSGGALQVTGALSSLDRASSSIMDFSGGNTRIFSIGANSATHGNILFETSTTTTNLERASITSDGYFRLLTNSSGIQFNGDTAAANALDDYEEGTWTPSLGGDATYLAQSGSYTKIGRVVNFKALVYVNLIGTGSTTTISGLPFVNAAGGGAVCSVPHYSGLATSVSSVNGNVSSTSISVNSNVGNATTNQTLNAIFQNSTYMEIAGTYNV